MSRRVRQPGGYHLGSKRVAGCAPVGITPAVERGSVPKGVQGYLGGPQGRGQGDKNESCRVQEAGPKTHVVSRASPLAKTIIVSNVLGLGRRR